MPPATQTDYDSPWKEIIEQFFPDCLQFFFPALFAQIDWRRGFTFLDKELQKITFDAETGRQTVDKLVRVHLRGGKELWLLVHLEVQGQRDEKFAERMMLYNARIFDRYRQEVVSLAILSDEHRRWRPSHYVRERFGCRVQLDFPMVKLLDYKDQLATLEQHENPFALVVLTHLRAQQTKRLPKQRVRAKLQLIRLLLERGYSKKQIGQLFRFLDWVLTLPAEEEREFQISLEEEIKVKRYVTSFERLGMEKGMERGMEKGMEKGELKALRGSLQDILQLRFAEVPQEVQDAINQINDVERLRQLQRTAVLCSQLEVFTSELALSE